MEINSTSSFLLFGAGVIALVVVGVGGWWYFAPSATHVAGAYTIVRGPLAQTVTFTGLVKPQERVDLGFERTGRVSRILAVVGDTVSAGNSLLQLESGDAYAAFETAQAELAREEARLTELERGATEQEKAVSQAKLNSAIATERETRESLISELGDAYTTVDSGIHATADQLFDRPRTAPGFKYSIANQQLKNDLEQQRITLEKQLAEWQSEVNTLYQAAGRADISGDAPLSGTLRTLNVALAAASVGETPTDTSALEKLTASSRTRLTLARIFFGNLAQAINEARNTGVITTGTADTLAALIAGERANIDAALGALDTAYKVYIGAVRSREVAEADLSLVLSGTREEQVALQRAVVDAEKAQVLSAQVELDKYTVRAPYDGVVIEIIPKQGEIVTAQTPVITLDSKGAFSVEARVSELDVIALRVGQAGVVTLDAYGAYENFPATIRIVDPAETEENGSLGYRTVLVFDAEDARLRAGLTANVTVQVVAKENVFAVPPQYILHREGGTFVQMHIDERAQEVEVTTGMVLPDGTTEIVSGVSEGDVLLPYVAP